MYLARAKSLLVFFSHRLPQPGDILIVLLQTTGKTVMAVAIANKIVVIRLGRMHGGLEGSAAGIANWSWGKSGMNVGVVCGLEAHVGVMKGSSIISVEQFSVDDAGVGLQRHLSVQTIVVNACYHRTLFGYGRFLFDDGSHRNRLGHAVRRISIQPDLLCYLAKLFHHRSHDVLHALGAREFVGIGEEVALQALCVRS